MTTTERVNIIANIMKTSKLNKEYLNNGYLLDFNETHINYEKELKFTKDLYVSNIADFFMDNLLADITTKLYFIGEIINEDDITSTIKTIIGQIYFRGCYYIYSIIQKPKKCWLDTIFPDYSVTISTKLKDTLRWCLSTKEFNSLDAWFKSRITGFTSLNLNDSYKIYDDFLDHYELTYEIVAFLYQEYEKITKIYCYKNKMKYNETLNNVLERNNLLTNKPSSNKIKILENPNRKNSNKQQIFIPHNNRPLQNSNEQQLNRKVNNQWNNKLKEPNKSDQFINNKFIQPSIITHFAPLPLYYPQLIPIGYVSFMKPLNLSKLEF
jgi:hypothetical protein